MRFEVPQEIRECTSECRREFSCLAGRRRDRCKVKFCVDDRLFFVKLTGSRDCPYVRGFGGEQLCTCPTRKEIHRRYGK